MNAPHPSNLTPEERSRVDELANEGNAAQLTADACRMEIEMICRAARARLEPHKTKMESMTCEKQ